MDSFILFAEKEIIFSHTHTHCQSQTKSIKQTFEEKKNDKNIFTLCINMCMYELKTHFHYMHTHTHNSGNFTMPSINESPKHKYIY